MILRSTAVVVVGLLTLLIAPSAGCDDDHKRPPLDNRVTEQGERLGKAQENAAATGDGESVAAVDSRLRAFQADSEGQLASLAADIERRSNLPDVPAEKLEQLRRDHAHLREQRQRVLDATGDGFEQELLQFNTHVNTIREQLARLDGKTTN